MWRIVQSKAIRKSKTHTMKAQILRLYIILSISSQHMFLCFQHSGLWGCLAPSWGLGLKASFQAPSRKGMAGADPGSSESPTFLLAPVITSAGGRDVPLIPGSGILNEPHLFLCEFQG